MLGCAQATSESVERCSETLKREIEKDAPISASDMCAKSPSLSPPSVSCAPPPPPLVELLPLAVLLATLARRSRCSERHSSTSALLRHARSSTSDAVRRSCASCGCRLVGESWWAEGGSYLGTPSSAECCRLAAESSAASRAFAPPCGCAMGRRTRCLAAGDDGERGDGGSAEVARSLLGRSEARRGGGRGGARRA